MPQSYPDLEGFAYSFARAECSLDGNIYSAITNVSFSQPTEEGTVKGTRPYPLARTEGTMGLGTGTITFSDERERLDFIDALGDAYRNKIWGLPCVLRGQDEREIILECISCRVLDASIDHSEGAEALGGDIEFSFMSHKINGKSPHTP
jgi:hypothetical protein